METKSDSFVRTWTKILFNIDKYSDISMNPMYEYKFKSKAFSDSVLVMRLLENELS